MKIKNFNDFSINEELFGIKKRIQEGMRLWKDKLSKDPSIKKDIEEGISKLSDSDKEKLKNPGLLQKILKFFNTDDAALLFSNDAKNKYLVAESLQSLFEKALNMIGSFLKDYVFEFSILTLLLSGSGAIMAGALVGKPMLVVIGVLVAAIGSILNKLSSDEY
jgi:hypothetical protein